MESPIRSSESSEGEESEVGASEVSKRTIEKRPSQRRTFATESCRMVKMTRSRTEENRSQKMSESEQNAWVLQFCMNQNASTLDQMVKVFNMQEKSLAMLWHLMRLRRFQKRQREWEPNSP